MMDYFVMIYFIVPFILFFIWFSWKWPKGALIFVLALLPTYQVRFQIFGIPVTLLEAMIIILYVVYLFKGWMPRWDLLRRWGWLFLAWQVVAIIAMFAAPDLRAGAGIWKAYFIEPILLLLVFLSLIKTKKDFHFVIGALSFSALYISIWAILQKFLGGGVLSTEIWGQAQVWRTTGPFPHPNFLGLFLGPIIILAIGRLISSFKLQVVDLKRKLVFPISKSIFYLFVILLALIAIILARAEGAILGVAAGVVFLGLAWRPVRKWTVAGLMILILTIGLVPSTRGYVIEKATFSDLSGQLRINIWKGAAEMIQDNPVIGVGLNGYQKLAPAYQNRYYHPQTGELISVETHPYPHNLFFALWLELGLAGLFIFLLIIVRFFKKGFQKIKKQDVYSLPLIVYSSMASMLAIVVHGLVDTPYFKNDLSVLFWLIIGIFILSSNHNFSKTKS